MKRLQIPIALAVALLLAAGPYFVPAAPGTRLEQALSTTPKPFLTVAYGALHALTGDWRPIVWASILVAVSK